MKKGLPIILFVLSCAYGLPIILDTKESTTSRTLESQLLLNSTLHPFNITENNGTIPEVIACGYKDTFSRVG
ncbi:hypothetical protein SKAU_G00026490 [Synaphobranchus kaupii]|uniref:Uncharacterized protein n=1 Tax=Synaphobranchus kaupii TaxID=118154 RepID=A0A9Q1GCT4_SYNKA|nr:hypothetical protein SKAU_G00026490 [Synaphobranchus kaupii]